MSIENAAQEWIDQHAEAFEAFRSDGHVMQSIGRATAEVLGRGGTVLACGNGGSGAQADHLAGELVGRFRTERRGLPAISLGSSPATLSAVANDYGYDDVFARGVEAFGREGDVLLAFSTSGESPNVLRAAERARELGLSVFGFSGKGGGRLAEICDQCLTVASDNTACVQEMHLIALHVLCDIVDRAFDIPG
jgi:D-sedoheptulose 7-phosphate isomerase